MRFFLGECIRFSIDVMFSILADISTSADGLYFILNFKSKSSAISSNPRLGVDSDGSGNTHLDEPSRNQGLYSYVCNLITFCHYKNYFD